MSHPRSKARGERLAGGCGRFAVYLFLLDFLIVVGLFSACQHHTRVDHGGLRAVAGEVCGTIRILTEKGTFSAGSGR